ncbi:uncharacterized protein METZ01_LOCUS145061 [marine metagenome]|uniref:4Fe-4S ferredoxin-type domain-containing protein n=1 Tax=marine metagenome TaxID=408172 RepID=A0A381ZTS4_9ZZZZ
MGKSIVTPLASAFGQNEKRLLQECIHCGFCLPACPTYMENGKEMDSPRGRLYLMESAINGNALMDEAFSKHVNLCLVCRACETACPSGVQFGHLMEITRSALAETKPPSFFQKYLLKKVLTSHGWLSTLFTLMRVFQKTGLQKLFSTQPFNLLVPQRIRTLQTSIPLVPPQRFGTSEDLLYSAVGKKNGTVSLFTGCVMDHLYPHVHAATVRLLTWYNFDVNIPAQQTCCGALHAHSGDTQMTSDLAQSNIDLFENTDSDYIIINSAGCGAHLKSNLKYMEAGIPGKILDLSEFLIRMETKQVSNGRLLKVAYDEPCHLLHGQGVSAEPKSLLSQIPGVELVSLKEADRCCGSAGSYSLTETEMSLELLERKMDAVMETGADILVTANPGCQIQLAWGVRRRKIEMEVLHLAQFLDRIFSNEPGYPTKPTAKAN